MNIEIIAGSPRNPSLNLRVAKYLHHFLSASTNHNVGLIKLNEVRLPFVQDVWHYIDNVPEKFREVGERIFNADAFIMSSPEYNGGYSPALKNLFDHFPKQSRKAFGIVTTSDGMMGGIRASQQLLQLVPALFGIASPQLLIVPQANLKFDEQGNLTHKEFEKNISSFVSSFLWLAEKLYS
jgi:NAD(P)H-dependent FMN reductase